MLPPPRASGSAPPPPSVPRATDGAAIGGALAESSAQIVRAECARCQQRQLCSCRRVVALARAAGGGGSRRSLEGAMDLIWVKMRVRCGV